MKQEIESAYIAARYHDHSPGQFADNILAIFGKESKGTRTNLQNRSRWKYLSIVASVLNDQGQTYSPEGMDIEIKWNKDLLYEIYWQTARSIMFPQKRKQLNTKEFSNLVDVVMDIFAKVFEINIPFPNIQDLLNSKELG